ncbi:hypothetical protein DPMN_106596 [Dreissena polymorpha]|uniref:Uncharacterized protein n=1 Tax=Dreissena polymorpha TaxID=45954 RepID=A0A9D4K5C5_DREPO|nr:hypothetical protein DPMN_106596 [Dreissena polymorpha]
MFKCLYPAFCVCVKRPGLAAVESDGDFDGLVETVHGGEDDGTTCPQTAQSVHRCGHHDNYYSDLRGAGTVLEQCCSLKGGRFFKRLVVFVVVCTLCFLIFTLIFDFSVLTSTPNATALHN